MGRRKNVGRKSCPCSSPCGPPPPPPPADIPQPQPPHHNQQTAAQPPRRSKWRQTARKSTGGCFPGWRRNSVQIARPSRNAHKIRLHNQRSGLVVDGYLSENENNGNDVEGEPMRIRIDEVRSLPRVSRQGAAPVVSNNNGDSDNYITHTLASRASNALAASVNMGSNPQAALPSEQPSQGQPEAESSADRVVVRIPIPPPYMSFNRLGAESSRKAKGQNEAAVSNAVNAAVAALKVSSMAPGNTRTEMEGDNAARSIEQDNDFGSGPGDSDRNIPADSTNSVTNICEPSSTSTPFVPPPAVAGHSRWYQSLPLDNLASTAASHSENKADIVSTVPRRKKKHYTPLPFPGTDPAKRSKMRTSHGNSSLLGKSISPSAQHHDMKKVKNAFKDFQSIRRLLTIDTGICTNLDGYVHLNAVERMLIKCYDRLKKISKSDSNQQASNPPPSLIVLEDSNDVVQCPDVTQRSLDEDVLMNEDNPISPPALSSDIPPTNVEGGTISMDSPSNLETNRSSSAEINLASSSSSASTASMGKNVAKQKASKKLQYCFNKASTMSRISASKRSSTTSQDNSNPTASIALLPSQSRRNHIDAVIDAVIRGNSPASAIIRNNDGDDGNPPPLASNSDLQILSQLNEAHQHTLNRLLVMGFGSDGDNLNQLLRLVRDNNGSLEVCLDKLTR